MNDTATIKAFCTEALATLGMEVAEDSNGLLSVSLPPSSLDLFEGRPSLRLAFNPELLDDGVDLVVPGSYVLERLIESARMRGQVTAFSVDQGEQLAPSPGLNIDNAETRLISSRTNPRNLLLLTFRVSLVSDEDQDRLFRVLIDCATGNQCEIDPECVIKAHGRKCPPTGTDGYEKAFSHAQVAAMNFAREWTSSAQQKIDARLTTEINRLEAYYRDLLADESRSSRDTDVRKAQKRRERALDTYTKLDRHYAVSVELLQAASTLEALNATYYSKLAALKKRRAKLYWSTLGYEETERVESEITTLRKAYEFALSIHDSFPAESRCAALEKERQEALSNLRKRQEEQEITKSSPEALAHLQERSQQLELEKAQRVAELREKSHLKVAVQPVSAAYVAYPEIELGYEASCGNARVAFTSHQDPITGNVAGPECQSCGGRMANGYLCACGHIACPTCHKTCAGCGVDLCSKCVTHTCAICHDAVCEDCLRTCATCGIVGCKQHVVDCPSCGRAACTAHSVACRLCGQAVCRECIGKSGHCLICESLFASASSQPAIEQILTSSGRPAKAARGHWLVGESRAGFVLVRKGLRLRAYVADKSTGKVRSERMLGILDSIEARREMPG